MAAAPQPVTEAAAQVAKSIQSMTAAHIKNEELNNNAQVPMVRHALSQVESTQKDQELQRVMEQVTVNTQPNRDEHLLKCLIKSQMADHPQQWDDHCGDIRYVISSFKRFQGDFKTLFKVSQGHDRYYWCCQSQSISLGRLVDGSGHLDSQMSSQALKIRSFMRFITCSTGSVMPSITCTTSGWLTASCSTVTPRQVMEDTTSTQGHSEAKWKTYQKCQRSQGQESSGSSSIRIQCHTRTKSSTRRSSFTSSSHFIRSGQQKQRCSTSIRVPHRS